MSVFRSRFVTEKKLQIESSCDTWNGVVNMMMRKCKMCKKCNKKRAEAVEKDETCALQQ